MSECDCTAYCGDDPDIHRGKIKGCDSFLKSQRYGRLCAQSENLLSLVIEISSAMRVGINSLGNDAPAVAVELCRRCEAVIDQVNGQ